MRLSLAFLLVCVSIGLLAVSPGLTQEFCHMLGYDNQRSGFSELPFKFPPVLSWRFSSGEKGADAPIGSAAVSADTVYAPIGSTLYAVDRETGAQRFKHALGGKCFTTPLVANNVVYVGTDARQMLAISADKGQRLWGFPVTAAIRSTPLLYGGVLYFGSDDGRFYALNLETRKLNWYFEAGGQIRSAPAYYRGILYFANSNGILYALKVEDGSQVWNTSLGVRQMFASPVVDRRHVLIGAGNSLVALELETGITSWSFQTYGLVTGSPALKDRNVFVGSKDGSLYCVSGGNGKGLWRYPKEGTLEPVLSSPTVQGDTVVFRSGPRLIVALDARAQTAAEKRVVWQYTLPQPPTPKAPGPEGMPGAMAGMPGGPMVMPNPDAGMPPAGPDETGRSRGSRQYVVQRWEDNVDPNLVLADNAAYLIGDDFAVYGFDTRAADNSAPQVLEALLDIRGEGGFQVRYPLVVDRGDTFPGRWADVVEAPGAPPISLSFVLQDAGSGVDPRSISAKLDDQPAEVTYDAKQGLVWYVYDPRPAAVNMRNGVRNLFVTAADWMGNKTEAQMSFTVDNSLPRPAPPTPTAPVGPEGGMPLPPGMAPGAPGAPAIPPPM